MLLKNELRIDSNKLEDLNFKHRNKEITNEEYNTQVTELLEQLKVKIDRVLQDPVNEKPSVTDMWLAHEKIDL